jgi:hypothetical protein
MFIQGSLQTVFDALYILGKIDPALREDWGQTEKNMQRSPEKMKKVLKVVNAANGDVQALVKRLQSFDDESLLFLTLEVAREFVDFESTKIRH